MNGLLVVFMITAFAAFCMWLSVRIANRNERWTKLTSIGLFIVAVGYPASVGPVCWWLATPDTLASSPRLPFIYWPLGRVAANGPDLVYKPVRWWMGIGMRRG